MSDDFTTNLSAVEASLCKACGGTGLRPSHAKKSKPLLAYVLAARLCKPAKERHRIFCEAYVDDPQACKWRAAQAAGYAGVDPSSEPTREEKKRLNKEATRLLKRPDVKTYIKALGEAKLALSAAELGGELVGDAIEFHGRLLMGLARRLWNGPRDRRAKLPK